MTVTILEPGSNVVVRGLATRVDVAARTESVSAAILATVFPDRGHDDTFVGTLNRCSRENVGGVVEVLAGRLALRDVDARCAREFAGLVARLGIPLAELERSYWVGVERLWRDWFDLCRTIASEGTAELPDMLGGSTSLLFGYIDRVLIQAVARYTEVTEEMAATSEDRRRDLVLRLLGGDAAEASEATETLDALLGYRTRATHVALFYTGKRHRDVARAFAALREESHAPASLLVQPDAGTWFGWLAYHDGVDPKRLELLRRTAAASGEQVTIGEAGRGLAGFRRSHETARRTAELRPTLREAAICLCARDLRLETFLLENPESARGFITDELGCLAEATERAQRIRETLLAWLSVGSQTRAATELGVHENTVRLRVRCASERLGAALTERRTELLVALRLCEALGPTVPPSE
ncbi:MAG TPA: helix-turn-helix domain-containing protein [Pseudonocardia sp.]|uniref:PucR family transcriptional regulator n=1 Tax=Pseudonocardia sp. TaxID=60912 RepID=UPI002F3F09EB